MSQRTAKAARRAERLVPVVRLSLWQRIIATLTGARWEVSR